MIAVIPNWHPLAVHFTVALLLTSSGLFALGTVLGTRPSGGALTTTARWNLAIGIGITVATLATGWWAYNTVAHDAASHRNMTIHLRWAVATALVFLAAGGVAWSERRKPAGAGLVLLVLLAGGSGALAVTGWLGGENVYRYGLGVMALPKSGDHVHPGGGDHGDGQGHAHDDQAHEGSAHEDHAHGGPAHGGQAHGGPAHDHTPTDGAATPEAVSGADPVPAPAPASPATPPATPHDHTP
ncbi:hypothetical protein ASF58_17875 [Methylobacterium sp. Leaf125]|uniref:DUF2231 domain-containing protein n=1 Tax=Methylobacterium sp. Leaf125 TaxID=1736265 RepID=UPI0006F40E96|nr:DUF2231 domain-containing protein [Methylobacterium sp. Leaf125]KQQ46262.1 hypothetical protein ASF58_17875 [Methylobacterium sp. Leaf125]